MPANDGDVGHAHHEHHGTASPTIADSYCRQANCANDCGTVYALAPERESASLEGPRFDDEEALGASAAAPSAVPKIIALEYRPLRTPPRVVQTPVSRRDKLLN